MVVNSQTRNSVNNYELLNLWHVSSNIQNIEHYCFVRPLNKNKLNDDVRNLKQSTFIVSNTTHYDSTLQDCKTKPYIRSPNIFFLHIQFQIDALRATIIRNPKTISQRSCARAPLATTRTILIHYSIVYNVQY